MDSSELAQKFDAFYFAHCCGRPYQRDEEWMRFFSVIADRIVQDIVGELEPGSVLDAGCAWGFLVEALRARGVEAYGLDISEFAIQHVLPEIQPYCRVGSVVEPLDRRYDLIVCIEVLEHLPQSQAEKAIENLCQHCDQVLFSSTPFDYKEASHFNVQPPEYWAECFARQGFFRDIDYDAAYVTPWAVRYRRRQEPLVRMVREYERRFFQLWKENFDLRQLTVESRDQLAALESRLEEKEQLVRSLSEQNVELDRQYHTSENQLQDIQGSRSWKMMLSLQVLRQRLLPLGSARERWFKRLLGKR